MPPFERLARGSTHPHVVVEYTCTAWQAACKWVGGLATASSPAVTATTTATTTYGVQQRPKVGHEAEQWGGGGRRRVRGLGLVLACPPGRLRQQQQRIELGRRLCAADGHQREARAEAAACCCTAAARHLQLHEAGARQRRQLQRQARAVRRGRHDTQRVVHALAARPGAAAGARQPGAPQVQQAGRDTCASRSTTSREGQGWCRVQGGAATRQGQGQGGKQACTGRRAGTSVAGAAGFTSGRSSRQGRREQRHAASPPGHCVAQLACPHWLCARPRSFCSLPPSPPPPARTHPVAHRPARQRPRRRQWWAGPSACGRW